MAFGKAAAHPEDRAIEGHQRYAVLTDSLVIVEKLLPACGVPHNSPFTDDSIRIIDIRTIGGLPKSRLRQVVEESHQSSKLGNLTLEFSGRRRRSAGMTG